MMLVAKTPILYRSTQYKVGERLPADNQRMVNAWIDAGSAEWKDETAKAQEKPAEEKKVETKKAAVKKTTKKGAKE